MSRHEITEEQWNIIEPLLPKRKSHIGRPPIPLGIWERIWRKLLGMLQEKKRLNWDQVYLDGSFVATKRGGTGIGNTKMGKSSKVMAVSDKNGIPIGILVESRISQEIGHER